MLNCHLTFSVDAILSDGTQFSPSSMPGILKGPKQQCPIRCQVTLLL